MYQILEETIGNCGLSKREVADGIHMNYGIFLSKISGSRAFTLEEALVLRSFLQEDSPIEVLFQQF